MDNSQGNLTDIFCASGASYGSFSTGTSSSEAPTFSGDHWQFSSDPMMMKFSTVLEDPYGNFGDPFSNTMDSFLHELDIPGSAYFNSTISSAEITSCGRLEKATCFVGGGGSSSNASVLPQKILEDDMRRPCNSLLSNMIQISPNAKCDSPVMPALSRVVKPSAMVSGKILINAKTSKDHCLMGNTGVQISSPRNPGLKRRKSQGKRSICIPAAAAAPNSRQSGEVVPSDLWAWRKYGQKPIKGSPYPRSYYRCSSSKGCPARKQVERSRTDPNMLVITYTSEHNHSWPTQRTKNYAASKNSETTQLLQQKGTRKPEEGHQESNSDSNVSPVVVASGNSANSASVKEEFESIEKKHVEVDDDAEFSNNIGLPYMSSSKLKCNQLEELFAELGEIEADSLNQLSLQGFNAVDDDQHMESKALEPFHLFDLSGDNNNNTKYHLI